MEHEENNKPLSKSELIDLMSNKILNLESNTELEHFVKNLKIIADGRKTRYPNRALQAILSHPKRNNFFDQTEIDWVYKAFTYPELIINVDIFKKALAKEITNPIDAVAYFLEKSDLNTIITPRLFYKRVLCNKHINTARKLNAAFYLLSITHNLHTTLNNLEEPLYRYLYNDEYLQLVIRCAKLGKKTDVFETIEYIENDIINVKVEYTGEILLPEHCQLISNKNALTREGQNMKHCIGTYWDKVIEKSAFIIHMEQPESLTFLIGNYKTSNWFHIESASGIKNQMPSHIAMGLICRFIDMEENQHFFRENYCKPKHFFVGNGITDNEEFAALLERL